MPRRKAVGDDQLPALTEGPPLMLTTSRPTHRHAHEVDPYESPPGAVAAKSVLLERKTQPIRRRLTEPEKRTRAKLQAEQRMRASRYERFLDARADAEGDSAAALAKIYGLTPEAVELQFDELLADVRSGIGSMPLAMLLERNDATLAARVRALSRHMYSDNPAASLKAIDMLTDTEGERSDRGSFENYLRAAKSEA